LAQEGLCFNPAIQKMTAVKTDASDIAEASLRRTGARMTRPRIAVLAVLLAAERALTHTEVESRLPASLGVNRVTIYRVLEWLTEQGLAHKIAGDDRVWRFNAAEHAHRGPHAHFQCSDCGQVLCLDPVTSGPAVKLPAGYRQQRVELTVKGLCADCVPVRRKAGSHRHPH
jgi:Fur family ferric uptake transcriptional regulator